MLLKYVFRDDHLELDNQWMFSSWGRATSLAPHFTALHFTEVPVILCVGLRLDGLLCSLACSLVSSLLRSYLGGHDGDT